MSRSRILVTFVFFFAVALATGWHSLDYPMVYDDLHLIRHFSRKEIRGVFVGHWDPDLIETAGFRPLSVLYNHTRYCAFGENVVAHRVYLMVQFAAFLTMLAWLAGRVGVGWRAALAAGVLCLCTVWSVFHTVWLTDGNHVFQGVLIGVTGVALVKGMETRRIGPLAISIVFLVAALLVREDSLGAVPVLILIAFVRAWDLKRRDALRTVALWTAAAVALGVALLAYRKIVIPYASPPGTSWATLALTLVRVLQPMGTKSFDTASSLAIKGWRVGLGGLLLLLVVLTWQRVRAGAAPPRAWLWAAATVSGSLSTLTMGRQDLYFFATAFASLFVVTAVADISRGYAWFRPLGLLLLTWGVLGGAYVSHEFSYNFHPWSDTAIWMNGQFVCGVYENAPIPRERRRAAADRLASLGIRSANKLVRLLPRLSNEALAAGRRQPGPEGMLFVPRLRLNLHD